MLHVRTIIHIYLCAPVIFGEEPTSVKLHGAFESFFRFLIFMSVMFHTSYFQTHAMKCCQQLVGNVARNSKKVCLCPQKIAGLICVLSESYLLPPYHT